MLGMLPLLRWSRGLCFPILGTCLRCCLCQAFKIVPACTRKPDAIQLHSTADVAVADKALKLQPGAIMHACHAGPSGVLGGTCRLQLWRRLHRALQCCPVALAQNRAVQASCYPVPPLGFELGAGSSHPRQHVCCTCDESASVTGCASCHMWPACHY